LFKVESVVNIVDVGRMPASIFAPRPVSAPVGRSAHAPFAAAPPKPQSVSRILETLRDFFGKRPNSVLLGAFREQDMDGSGQLELPEFKRALKGLNIDLTDADLVAVFNALDSDGSGVLQLREFLNELKAEPDPRDAQWLRLGIGHQYVQPNREPPSTQGVVPEPWLSGFNRGNRELVNPPEARRPAMAVSSAPAPAGPAASASAETALQLLRDFFGRRRVSSLLTLFQDVDVDNSGQIEPSEFCAALRQLNMHISEEDMLALFNFFDKDGSGMVEIREILSNLRVEPTPEEARWQRVGIGKQTLYPTRDVYVKGVKPSTGESGFARSVNPAPPLKWMPTSRVGVQRPATAHYGADFRPGDGRAPSSIFR